MFRDKFTRDHAHINVRKLIHAVTFTFFMAANLAAATFTINWNGDLPDVNTADGICDAGGGVCSLRAAIQQGNALPGNDLVLFAIPGTQVHVISPMSALPNITDSLTIDAWSQGGVGYQGPPRIELNGTSAGMTANGLTITTSNTLIRGLAINRFGAIGISLSNANSNEITGCYLGTDTTGTIDRGNGAQGL